MTVPHYISENQSDMRGIKHGWYAIEDDGNLSSGPFPVSRNASRKSASRRTGRWRLSCNKGRTEHFSNGLPASGVEGGVRRSTQTRPLKDECHDGNH